MLTVLDVINSSTEYLNKKGIESARTNAELLLADVLHCKRLDLYLMYDKPLSESELNEYRQYLKRRSVYEPLQYITGKVEFYGLDFIITPSVLIPRPETEILVELVINSIKTDREVKILDIGCGCGNIGIAIAANLPNAKVSGIDISKDAISIAEENTVNHNLQSRVNFRCVDILNTSAEKLLIYDIVVSNPPYVSKLDYETLQKEIKNFEPEIAVTDVSDGFSFYKSITPLAKQILNKPGKIFYELGQGQSKQVKKILEENGFKKISIIQDYGKIDRVISGVVK
ncbi:MAG: peptide chain release factor N(5)-glutamine methyltransferase [Ignavibacterium sp.]|nr:MAG: peptide chain release factor N(5)-glutamine methyltransferase [Ignavibacterium sp.]